MLPLVKRSHQIWKEIEITFRQKALFPNWKDFNGFRYSSWEKHGTKSFLDQTISFAKEFGIVHKVINCGGHQLPISPHICLESTGKTYAEEATGYLLPEQCIATQLELAI